MKKEKYQRELLEKAEHSYECGWGFDGVKNYNKHFPTYEAGYGRSNPNENGFQKKKGKKRA